MEKSMFYARIREEEEEKQMLPAINYACFPTQNDVGLRTLASQSDWIKVK